MERTKQPKVFKRHRGRGVGERAEKKITREDRQNFYRHATRVYEDTPKGRMLHARMLKRRAKNKRSKAARKRNR